MSDDQWKSTTADYRSREVGDQWQPEMRYGGFHDTLWFPLDKQGYWFRPLDYSNPKYKGQDDVPIGELMSKQEADMACWRAMKINGIHNYPESGLQYPKQQ